MGRTQEENMIDRKEKARGPGKPSGSKISAGILLGATAVAIFMSLANLAGERKDMDFAQRNILEQTPYFILQQGEQALDARLSQESQEEEEKEEHDQNEAEEAEEEEARESSISQEDALIASAINISLGAVESAIVADELQERRKGAKAVYLHIHKAGGTSVCYAANINGERVLVKHNCNLPINERSMLPGTPELQEIVLQDALIKKKLSFIANEWILPSILVENSKLLYLTMLRNPLARSESHFAMSLAQSLEMLRKKGTYAVRCMHGDAWTNILLRYRDEPEDANIKMLIRQLWLQRVPDNWQIRAVCGADCAAIPFGGIGEEHLSIAKRKLAASFMAVGIIEHFPQSIQLYGRVLSWGANRSSPFGAHAHKGTGNKSRSWIVSFIESVQNRTSPEHGLPTLEWFYAANLFDIQLYNFAKRLFYSQLAAHDIPVNETEPLAAWVALPCPENCARDAGRCTCSESDHRPLAIEKDLLLELIRTYAANEGCSSQCCHDTCAPVGRFWAATARSLNLIPALGPCKVP